MTRAPQWNDPPPNGLGDTVWGWKHDDGAGVTARMKDFRTALAALRAADLDQRDEAVIERVR